MEAMKEAEFWGERSCPECGVAVFGQVNKRYCSKRCLDRAVSTRRRQNPEKRALDEARKREWRKSLTTEQRRRAGSVSRAEYLTRVRGEAASRKAKVLAERDLILSDWQFIGQTERWSVSRVAPRLGVTPQQLGTILKEAREAGDPRGVIPETVGGERVYAAA